MTLGLHAGPALAQSVQDYRLPPQPGQSGSQPRAQGPVDAENPVVAPATPATSATPVPAPTISLPPPEPRAVASPAPQPAVTSSPSPRPAGKDAPARAVQPKGAALPAVTETTTEPLPASPAPDSPVPETPFPEAARSTEGAPAPAPSEAEGPAFAWWWAAVAGAVVLLSGLALLLHRRRKAGAGAAQDDWAAPESPAAPQPAPPAKLPEPMRARTPPIPARPQSGQTRSAQPARPATPAPTTPPVPARAPLPPSSDEALPLAVGFEPGSMRLSLVFATLPYSLTVQNLGNDAIGPVRLLADLGSAHASLSTNEQLAPDPGALEPRHTIEMLAPGDTAAFSGELRVPLGAILPVRKGAASFFVPLARLCLIPEKGPPLRRVFTLGLAGPDAAAPLAPIRLDTGPRQFDGLAAREIEAARLLTLDPLRQAS